MLQNLGKTLQKKIGQEKDYPFPASITTLPIHSKVRLNAVFDVSTLLSDRSKQKYWERNDQSVLIGCDQGMSDQISKFSLDHGINPELIIKCIAIPD
jgi:hypothetical protein